MTPMFFVRFNLDAFIGPNIIFTSIQKKSDKNKRLGNQSTELFPGDQMEEEKTNNCIHTTVILDIFLKKEKWKRRRYKTVSIQLL
jgi:hypothetical protein